MFRRPASLLFPTIVLLIAVAGLINTSTAATSTLVTSNNCSDKGPNAYFWAIEAPPSVDGREGEDTKLVGWLFGTVDVSDALVWEAMPPLALRALETADALVLKTDQAGGLAQMQRCFALLLNASDGGRALSDPRMAQRMSEYLRQHSSEVEDSGRFGLFSMVSSWDQVPAQWLLPALLFVRAQREQRVALAAPFEHYRNMEDRMRQWAEREMGKQVFFLERLREKLQGECRFFPKISREKLEFGIDHLLAELEAMEDSAGPVATKAGPIRRAVDSWKCGRFETEADKLLLATSADALYAPGPYDQIALDQLANLNAQMHADEFVQSNPDLVDAIVGMMRNNVNKTLFFALPTAHLVGNRSVVELLSARGYKLHPMAIVKSLLLTPTTTTPLPVVAVDQQLEATFAPYELPTDSQLNISVVRVEEWKDGDWQSSAVIMVEPPKEVPFNEFVHTAIKKDQEAKRRQQLEEERRRRPKTGEQMSLPIAFLPFSILLLALISLCVLLCLLCRFCCRKWGHRHDDDDFPPGGHISVISGGADQLTNNKQPPPVELIANKQKQSAPAMMGNNSTDQQQQALADNGGLVGSYKKSGRVNNKGSSKQRGLLPTSAGGGGQQQQQFAPPPYLNSNIAPVYATNASSGQQQQAKQPAEQEMRTFPSSPPTSPPQRGSTPMSPTSAQSTQTLVTDSSVDELTTATTTKLVVEKQLAAPPVPAHQNQSAVGSPGRGHNNVSFAPDDHHHHLSLPPTNNVPIPAVPVASGTAPTPTFSHSYASHGTSNAQQHGQPLSVNLLVQQQHQQSWKQTTASYGIQQQQQPQQRSTSMSPKKMDKIDEYPQPIIHHAPLAQAEMAPTNNDQQQQQEANATLFQPLVAKNQQQNSVVVVKSATDGQKPATKVEGNSEEKESQQNVQIPVPTQEEEHRNAVDGEAGKNKDEAEKQPTNEPEAPLTIYYLGQTADDINKGRQQSTTETQTVAIAMEDGDEQQQAAVMVNSVWQTKGSLV